MSESNVPVKTPSELLADKIVGVLAEKNWYSVQMSRTLL